MKRNRNINEQEVIELYKTESIRNIAEKLNTYDSKISSILKKHGITPKSKFTVKKWTNDNFFDNIDDEEKAYVLGFFIADGCIRKEYDKRCGSTSYRMCFSNSIDDSEIINFIHDKICPNNKMIEVHNTSDGAKRKKQLNLQWTSRHMAETLINKYKILPKKTHDIDFEFPVDTIPKNLFRHFVRGFIDGDGCINNELVGAVFTSKKFAQQIINFFEKEFLDKKDLVEEFKYHLNEYKGKTVTYYKLSMSACKGRRKLYEKILYENANIFLNRKKENFNKKVIRKK